MLSSPFLMEMGEADQIDCVIEKGYPAPTIQWRRKGQKAILSDTTSLMFPYPTKEDQAIYHVKAENVVGSAEQVVLVNIRGGWTKIFEKSTEFALSQNNLLTTIPRLTKEWVVEFCFKPTNFNYGDWTNIIQMTIGGRHGSYGDRTPGVFYHPTQLGPSQLYFASAVNNNPNFSHNLPAPSVGKWTKIRVSQELLNTNKLMYRVIIDGVEKINVENKNTGLFQNVKVFAANPWHHAQPGFVKGLIIQVKGE